MSVTPSEPLRRISTHDALVEAVRSEILEGRLAPGSTLREADLCTRYGVSRHTVRTALQAITHEGLARHSPNRGVSVPQLSEADVLDLYALRTMLEVPATRRLAADPARRDGPRRALEALLGLSADAHWSTVRDADLEYHRAVVDALGSPRTSRTFGALLSELRLAFLQFEDELRDPGSVAEDHAGLFAAIETGDADAAEAAVRSHLDAAVASATGTVVP